SGSALDFNGSSDHVVIDNTASLNITGTEISLVAWINPRDGGVNIGSRIISKRTNAGGSEVYAMFTDRYRLTFHIDGQDMVSSHIIRLDDWTHVAMIYDGADMRIYVNGVLDVETPLVKTDPIDESNRAVHLGMREGEALHFNGIIDDVQIYNRALSASEVDALYDAIAVVPPPPPGLYFTDISGSAGISNSVDGGHGVMFAEVDNDSLPDLYLTNNFENQGARDEYFFDNTNGAVFAEVATARGIEDTDGGSHGAVWADFDNDGDYDLFNGSTWGESPNTLGNPINDNLYRNDGLATGSFTEVTPAAIQSTAIETRGVTAFDMDGDGDLDLYGVSSAVTSGVTEAFRNDGNFAFSSYVGGALGTTVAMQGVTDTDFDGDGDIDIFAANRTGDVTILQNDGLGIFTQILPASLGITHDARDGITTGDLDNDGDLDLLLVSDGRGWLYLRNSNTGLYVFQRTFNTIEGYMGGFADLDNDGDLDMVFAGDERTFLNDGTGTFVAGQSMPVSEIDDPRAIAFADIEGDGDLDFAIAAKRSRNWLIRNDFDAAGNWLKVALVSPQCQAGAFGAKTRVYLAGQAGVASAQIGLRESRGNYGYLAQDDPVLHFGLGAETSVDVVVYFLVGPTDPPATVTMSGVLANQRILIDECPP
ncbi:MAG: FG-GAP-like repeat-containing protein, partial [Woeseiaceae bacterium]